MTPTSTPPSWPVNWDLLPPVTDDNLDDVTEAVRAAIGILWALTGRRYGLTNVEARPCPPGAPHRGIPLSPGLGWVPVLDAGIIRNAPVCQAVACDRSGSILLPGPVHTILGWVVDGQEMPDGTLNRDGDRVWSRTGTWPQQDLSRPTTEYGTWGIRYQRGLLPPPGADGMIAALAKEILAATTGGTCRLPQRATQVQRQGVTVQMVDPQAIYDTGSTGITEVDLWIRAHNPYRQAQPSVVWSPDQEVW